MILWVCTWYTTKTLFTNLFSLIGYIAEDEKDAENDKDKEPEKKDKRGSPSLRALSKGSKRSAASPLLASNVQVKAYKKILIQLKGKNRIHVRQVELSSKSLNKSDVFILDAGDKIYDWNGAQADRKKREKGVDIANR